jgi:hypothetical protein
MCHQLIYDVLTAMNVKITVFWDVMLCCMKESLYCALLYHLYREDEGNRFLQNRDLSIELKSFVFQKTIILILNNIIINVQVSLAIPFRLKHLIGNDSTFISY